MNESTKTSMLAGVSILCALTIILQVLSGIIKIGQFSITLALVPIIIASLLYGPAQGAIVGFVLGIVVLYYVLTGVDVGGHLMFEYNPIVTIIICLTKTSLAGFVSGLVYKHLSKSHKGLGTVIFSSMLCPIVNTGAFVIMLLGAFSKLVYTWANAVGITSVITYVLTVLLGINFVIELGINIVVAPSVYKIVKIISNRIRIGG